MPRTSTQHALDIARLSPAIAARRTLQLATASPLAATIAMSKMVTEKSFAFSASWIGTALAVMSMQLRWMGAFASGTNGAGAWNLGKSINEGEKIASKALAPIAKRVKRNSRSH